ncbi:MAG: TonB-dependent receptor domain-containing protein [Pleurocapsa sp.]
MSSSQGSSNRSGFNSTLYFQSRENINLNEINTQLTGESYSTPAIAVTTPDEIKQSDRSLSNRASDLIAQGVTRVTGVEIKETNSGLEVILETAAGSQRLVPLILPIGNNLVIDILDATLALQSGNEFIQDNPVPGIKKVNLAQVDQSSIRLTITGENKTPNAEIVTSNQNLIFKVTTQATAQTKPEQEIVVTATRKEEQTADVPRSVTVIDREEIAEQSRISRNLVDIISKTAPGVNPPTGSLRSLSVRGRAAQVLINGVSIPAISRILNTAEDGFDLDTDVELSQPQKVDNYELGIRGEWQRVQASLAGFYNESKLGATLVNPDNSPFATLIRTPQRNYGVEASLDWQIVNNWQVGSTFTWQEGEDDVDGDGEFAARSSSQISPIKPTAYVENETLPGWNNRLQVLFVSDRNRAVDDGTEFVEVPIEGYTLKQNYAGH